MKFALGRKVGGMCEFGGGEGAKVAHLAVDHDSGKPSVVVLPSAEQSSFVVFVRAGAVLSVHGVRYVAQICNAVVRRIAVNVIKSIQRPFSVNVQPSKTMGFVKVTPNTNVDILPNWVLPPGNVADMDLIARSDAPNKNTRIAVVVKQFSNALCGNIASSHDAVPLLIGQRPRSVFSTAAASSF